MLKILFKIHEILLLLKGSNLKMNIFKLHKENSYRYNNSLLNFYSRVFFFMFTSSAINFHFI